MSKTDKEISYNASKSLTLEAGRMNSVVSSKGQTVIPHEIREALGITAGTRLHWFLKGKKVSFFVVPDDPVAAAMGLLKDSGYTFDDFMRERNEERRQERIQEEKEEKRWRHTSSTRRR